MRRKGKQRLGAVKLSSLAGASRQYPRILLELRCGHRWASGVCSSEVVTAISTLTRPSLSHPPAAQGLSWSDDELKHVRSMRDPDFSDREVREKGGCSMHAACCSAAKAKCVPARSCVCVCVCVPGARFQSANVPPTTFFVSYCRSRLLQAMH